MTSSFTEQREPCLPPTHVHNHEHDPNTDLDLSQDQHHHNQIHHLWIPVPNAPDNNNDTDDMRPCSPAPGRRNHHHRSHSSSSHKYYHRQESTSSSCCSRSSNENSSDSDSFRMNMNSKKSQSCQSPSPGSPERTRCSKIMTITGAISLLLLSCILLTQFSSDIRSAFTSMRVNQMFNENNDISSSDNITSEETFNNQVTSKIISLILPDDSVIRETRSGSLLGFSVREAGVKIAVFLGIPYAKPPIGKLRFAKPRPASSWKGLRDATRFGHQCIQFKPSNIHTPWINQEDDMSEDCLTLNVWAPLKQERNNNQKHNLLPVMVWFHGGAFFSGSTDLPLYDGRTLAAIGNIIIVSVNYRLGVFGFLDSKTTSSPGNQGLHDQVAALVWVKENIRMFGGDENEVTIFGQSAGGISVGLHYLSPISRALFRRGILQSGSPTVSRLFYERDPTATDVKNKLPQLSVMTGCIKDVTEYRKTPIDKIITCLKDVDVDILTSAQNRLIQELSLAFGPSAGDEFLPDLPINLIHNFLNPEMKHSSRRRRRDLNETTNSSESEYSEDYDSGESDVNEDTETGIEESNSLTVENHSNSNPLFNMSERTEIMMGVNADEGSYFLHYLDPITFGYGDKNLTYEQSLSFIGKQFNFLPPHFTKLLIDLFLSPSDAAISNMNQTDVNSIRRTLANFISDSTFTCPATLFAQLCSHMGMRTYFYLFDHEASIRRPTPDWMGVMHFDEVPFVFGHPVREPNLYTKEEVKFSKDIMTRWINFARYGSPNGESGSLDPASLPKSASPSSVSLTDLMWDSYTKDEPNIMLLKSSGNTTTTSSMILRDGIRDSTCSKWRIILENS